MHKKGQIGLGLLISATLILVVAGLLMSFSADLTEDVQADQVANSYASNVSDNTLQSFDKLSTRQVTIASVVGIAIVIGVLVSAFRFKGAGL